MKFNFRKATQAINYLIRNGDGHHIDKLELIKLVYLADRYHLRKYGRTITNDRYVAMHCGPVASSVKDIVDMTDFLSPTAKNYAKIYIKLYERHQIQSIKDVDMDVFSKTDIEALSAALDVSRKIAFKITKFPKKHGFKLADFTHRFPEWKKHEISLNTGNYEYRDIDLHDFFSTADKDIEYCNVSNEQLELNKAIFDEDEEIKRLLK